MLADHLLGAGHAVTFVTPAPVVSPWTENTLEQARIQRSLIEQGVDIRTNRALSAINTNGCQIACTYSGRAEDVTCDSVLLVTERRRETALYDALQGRGLTTLELIGDAAQPGLIADAVYSGHSAARAFQADPKATEAAFYRREIIDLSEEPHAG